MTFSLPEAGSLVAQVPVELRMAQREQELAEKVNAIDVPSESGWEEWMRGQLAAIRKRDELPALPLGHRLGGSAGDQIDGRPGTGNSRFVLCSEDTHLRFSEDLRSRDPHRIVNLFPRLAGQDELVIAGQFVWRISLDDIDFKVL